MARLVAGMASSHAFALNDPTRWDQGRRSNRDAYSYGSNSEEFDRGVVARMAEGAGSTLCDLTSADLLNNGDIEFRSWMVALGAVGDVRPELLVYEPFYRGILGMGVGFWSLAA